MRIKWVFPGFDRTNRSIQRNLSAGCGKAFSELAQMIRCLNWRENRLIEASTSGSVTMRPECYRAHPLVCGLS